MDEAYESRYHQLEATQWWCRARREIVRTLLRDSERASRVLEIGCSSGILLDELRREGFREVIGCDVSGAAAVEGARHGERRIAVVDGAHLAFADGRFDVVIASDVLEHIEDDVAALAEWRRVMRPAARLVVFVPAFMHLWGEHDALNRHFRRYTKAMLLERLEGSGFDVVRSSYWNVLLFFPASLVRFVQRWAPRVGSGRLERMEPVSPFVNALLLKLLRIENRWIARLDWGEGMSVFAVARKADSDSSVR